MNRKIFFVSMLMILLLVVVSPAGAQDHSGAPRTGFVTGGGWIDSPVGAFGGTVLDFEDLYPGYETLGPIPDGYAGFDWSESAYWITKYYNPATGYDYGTSGMVSLFTAWAVDISFGEEPFTLLGADITAAWNLEEEVIVEGWADGSLLYQTTIMTHNDQAYSFDFGWPGVDTVWLRPQPGVHDPNTYGSGDHIAIDNVKVCLSADDCPTGMATFGFVSKYNRGATVPTGNTEFQFHAVDLNFHSTSYESLVVADSDYAVFMGTGAINGDWAPNGELYKFMIWAGDGEPDTLRMKIWYEVDGTETVVYDNGFDQPLGSGSIIIHTK